MIYCVGIISSFLSGLGIGGGSIFMLATLLFNMLDLTILRTYNLAMFICFGIVLSFSKLNYIKKNKKMFFGAILSICGGAIAGFLLNKFIDEKIIKTLFYVFLLLIGIYEIISSLKSAKNVKNNNVKGEN